MSDSSLKTRFRFSVVGMFARLYLKYLLWQLNLQKVIYKNKCELLLRVDIKYTTEVFHLETLRSWQHETYVTRC